MTESELRRELESSKDLLGLQILTGAFVVGVLLFLVMTLAFWALGMGKDGAQNEDLSLFPS